MAKTVTLRLSDEEYRKILSSARSDNRPISSYITNVTLKVIEESLDVDQVEMDQILKDKKLVAKLERGHQEAKKKKGKFVD